MEILRFDESDAPAPKRKSASKGWLALGLVATLMGVGTAFASSTINVNGNNLASLGQGVSLVTGCDGQVNIAPQSGVDISNEKPEFRLSSIDFSDINTFAKDTNETTGSPSPSPNPNLGKGCGGQAFMIQVFAKPTGEDHPQAIGCDYLYSDPITPTVSGSAATGDIKAVPSVNSSGCVIYVKIAKTSILDDTFSLTDLNYAGDVSYITIVSVENYPV